MWAAALDKMTDVVRDTFPAAVVWDPSGAAISLTAVFDEASELVDVDDDGAQVSTTAPMVEVKYTDLGQIPRSNDMLTIAEMAPDGTYGTPRLWEVVSAEPDGSGNYVCYLTAGEAAT